MAFTFCHASCNSSLEIAAILSARPNSLLQSVGAWNALQRSAMPLKMELPASSLPSTKFGFA
jgi:hypothetical protein